MHCWRLLNTNAEAELFRHIHSERNANPTPPGGSRHDAQEGVAHFDSHRESQTPHTPAVLTTGAREVTRSLVGGAREGHRLAEVESER